MEFIVTNGTSDNCSTPTSSITCSVPILHSDGVNLLPTESVATVVSDTTTTQIFNIPIMQEGASLDTPQSYILATSADGNTILLDASQLAVLPEQTIPVYDGSTLFQMAPQSILNTSAKAVSSQERTVVIENAEPSEHVVPLAESEEILPPDRQKIFKCPDCGIEYSSKRQLQRHHWKVHADEKPHQCSECNASFNKESNLVLHQATHNTSDPACPECHKKFTRMASLKSHLMLHEAEENLVCSECGDEFSTQFKLDKHAQEHLMEQLADQTFVCRICSSGFEKLNYLKEHMKLHYKLKTSLNRRQYKRNIDRTAFIHKCCFCGKQFQKPSQLLRHNRIHTGERPYKCTMCDRAFNQKGALMIHAVKHTGVRNYICDFCPAAFAQKGNLRNHIRRVHTFTKEEAHKCRLCSCSFRKLGSLNAHMSRAHSAQSVTFIELPKGEDEIDNPDVSVVVNQLMEISNSNYEGCMRTELSKESLAKFAVESNVSADILQQALENSGLVTNKQSNKSGVLDDTAAGAMRRHIMRNVNGVKWYQCIYCTKEFKKPSDLVRHIRIHTHEKPYKCGQCFRAFAVKSTLSAHVRTHSGIKEFSCEHCKKYFSTSGSLKVHMLLHTGARPFSCPTCSKTFRTSGHRKSHMASHDKDRKQTRSRRNGKSAAIMVVNDINVEQIPLQEPILITDEGYLQQVPKNSVLYNQLVLPQSMTERPYRCEICEKGYKKSSHLKQHIRSHTGEKPYKCFQCEKSFVSNGVLKAHQKTHTDIRNFVCHICSTSFTTNGSLQRHMCIHSNDRPYMCPYCQKTFKTSMNCKKHMNTHRYELAMGMASSGVAVTVESARDVPEAVQSVEIVETENPVEENGFRQVITLDENFTLEAETTTTHPEVLPQQLGQEVFNTPNDIVEHVEEIPQAQAFEQTPSLMFHTTDFVDSSLAFGSTVPAEEYVNDLPVSVMNSNVLSEKTNETKQKQPKKRTKNFKKPFKCEYCDKLCKKSSHLKLHLMSHTGEKNFRCNMCNVSFTTARSLLEHTRARHQGVREYKCPVCTSIFANKSSLVRHMVLHDVDQPFHCAYCSEKFTTKEIYRQHLKDFHANTVNTKEAVEVPASIAPADEETPTEKERACVGGRHECVQCSKSFKKPSDLIRHVRIHTGEKPYKCDLCSKCFTVKSTLDSHLKTHTGEKNFSCQVCGSRFATKGSLKVHVRLHTGSRPFKCPHCDQNFRTSGHCKSHMASHFKENGRKNRRIRGFNQQFLNTCLNDKKDRTVEVVQETPQVPPPPTNLITPNIQLTALDTTNMVSKPITIDASVLQQLQQHFNLNITFNPSLTTSDPGQVINLDSNFTLTQPNVIVHQLGYTLTPHQTTEITQTEENGITLIIPDSGFQNQDFDTLTLENGGLKNPEHLVEKSDVQDVLDLVPLNSSLTEPQVIYECNICDKRFVNINQLSRHLRTHKVKTKDLYHCQTCNQDFKKKNQLMKHLKSHR